MRKTILFLKGRWRAALLVLLLSAVGMGESLAQNYSNVTIGDLKYDLNGSTLTATVKGHVNGTSATGSLTIPSSVTWTDCNTYSVTTIWQNAFKNCNGFTGDLTIPNSVTTIGNYAFQGCSGFTGSLTIPNSVTSIGDWAFYNCSGFTGSLTIGDSVTTIGDYAFYGCSGFTGSLTFPNSVTTIGSGAFRNCSGFTGDLIIPNSVITIGGGSSNGNGGAFQNCSGFTGDLTIPNSVTTIGMWAFNDCSFNGLDINMTIIPEGVFSHNGDCNTNFTGSLTIGDSVTTIRKYAFSGCSGFTGDLTLPNSVTTIGNYAFYGCSGFTGSLTIGNSVTTIGNEAFRNCSGFTGSLTIGESVTTIGYGAFSGCSGFTGNLVIPDSVVTIAGVSSNGESNRGAFYGCTGFTSLNIGSSVTSIGWCAFYGCSGFTGDLTIPNSVTTIGNYAFYNCSGFTGSLTIGDSVTEIGNDAFYNCSGFTGSLTIGESVTTIGGWAFSGCSGFTGSLTIPNSVTSIGDWAFYNCSGFTGSLTIGDSVTTIRYGAFYNCSGFTGDLIIPNSVNTIENPPYSYSPGAFEGCSGFTGRLTIGNSVATIGAKAFYNCSGFTEMRTEAETPPSLGNYNTFYNVSLSIPLYVPCGSQEAYEGANIWRNFTNMKDMCPHVIYAIIVPAGAGVVTGSGTYPHDSIATLVATPNLGYVFFNWTLEGQQVSLDTVCSLVSLEDTNIEAHFTDNPVYIDITATTDPVGGGIISGDGVYLQGQIATLSVAPDEDFVFLNWTKDGEVVSTETSFNFLVTEDEQYVAHFNPIHQVTVVAVPAEGGTVTGEGRYEQGTSCTLSASVNTGYDFQCWTKEYGPVINSNLTYTFTVTEPATYEAHFAEAENVVIGTDTTANSYLPSYSNFNYSLTQQIYTADELSDVESIGSLSFYNEGETKTRNYTIYMVHTDKALFTSNTDWITVGAGNKVYSGTVTMTEGTWTTITLQTPFYYNGTSNIALVVDDNTGSSSSGMSCRVFDANGSQSIRVYSDGTNYSPNSPWNYTGTRLYVKNCIMLGAAPGANMQTYTISATAVPAVAGTVEGGGTYLANTTAMLTATPNEYGTFINWTKDGEEVSTEATIYPTVTEDASYVANFELNSYEITATANLGAGGTVDGAGVYYHFDTCTLTATANVGYTFINWTKDGEEVSTEAIYSFEVTSEAAFVANFELNSYDIEATANPELGGMVEGAGVYYHFDTCTLAATVNEGYHFINWTKNGEEVTTDLTYSFTVTEAASYVANFGQNTFDITATANPLEGGVVDGAGTYGYGATCTLTATANTGYHFVNWTKDGEVVSTEAVYSFTGTVSGDYVANFELNSYEIAATTNLEESGTVTGAGVYNHFDTCTLTAAPNVGYHFLNWTMNGEVVSTESTYSFEVTGAASYVANFELNSYDITATANPEAGGTVTGSGTYDYGTTCTLTATPSEGYAFLSWTKGGVEVSTNETYSFEVTEAANYVANFELTTITQATNLTSGWNWWSTYVESDDLFNQLKTGLGGNATQIKSNTTFVNYFNGMWIGGLSSINNESCYLIKANNACTLETTGMQAMPANHPITINPNWNWIGYPNTGAQSVANAFSNFTPVNGDQVKSQNAFATYYGNMWIGGLNSITPGMGLLYKSNSTSAMTLVYPEANRSEEWVENVTNEDNHWTADYHAYPGNMTVMAVIELDDVELQGENYEIAAFADGECRGSARLMYVAPINRYIAFLTIVGDEASELRFSLYDSETGVVETQDVASLQYETNATMGSLETPYVIRFRSTTGMDEWATNVNIFPNPVNRGERFSLGMTDNMKGRVQVEIVNALGMVVETQNLASPQDLAAPKVAGVYTLRITVEGKGTCYRKLVVR